MKTLLDNREIVSVIVTFLMFIMIGLTSCHDTNVEPLPLDETGESVYGHKIKEVEIDGCQYYVITGIKRFGITHKGNCTNH